MPKICYIPKEFEGEKARLITICDRICQQYTRQGYDLTLRQLYYVLVAQDLFPDSWKWVNVGKDVWRRHPEGTKNATPNYTNLSTILSDARLAGLIDWNHIVDRTRNLSSIRHWDKPSTALKDAHDVYHTDKWLMQPNYVEVWIEKDALEGVIEPVCNRLDVPFFSCRGYTSQSAMWGAGQRLRAKVDAGKEIHIVHLGDHDPSGVDMSRDIKARLTMFMEVEKVHVLRAALNFPQIRRFNPPPNPAKITDPRAKGYIATYGDLSWELDALNPATLTDIVNRAVRMFRDETLWATALEQEKRGKTTLGLLHSKFTDVVKFLRENK